MSGCYQKTAGSIWLRPIHVGQAARLFAAGDVLVLVLARRIDPWRHWRAVFGRGWSAQVAGFFFRSNRKGAAARPVLAATPPGEQSRNAVDPADLRTVAGQAGLTPAALRFARLDEGGCFG